MNQHGIPCRFKSRSDSRTREPIQSTSHPVFEHTLTAVQSRRRTSSAQSPNRLGRAVKGAWRRLSPSREVVQPKFEEKNDALPQDVKGPLGLNLLHSPPNPQIDFIFVHGLGGGSRKTWSLSPDPEHYWPKAWLPKEPDFDSVRVHSFGYNADWDNLAKSTMSILDFARSLIEDISHNPAIRKSNVS